VRSNAINQGFHAAPADPGHAICGADGVSVIEVRFSGPECAAATSKPSGIALERDDRTRLIIADSGPDDIGVATFTQASRPDHRTPSSGKAGKGSCLRVRGATRTGTRGVIPAALTAP
jgi:hypothetical protein